MDRIIETTKNKTKNGTINWSAVLYEKTNCLYRCEHCGKVILTPVTVHWNAYSTAYKTKEDAANAVTKSAETSLKRLAYNSSRSVSDLLDAHLSQRCRNCFSQPAWLSLEHKASKQAAIWYCISMLIPLALYIVCQIWSSNLVPCSPKGSYSRHGNSGYPLLSMFVSAIGILGFLGGLLCLWQPIEDHFRMKVSFSVYESLKTTLPLYGETVEDIEVQARDIPQYQGLAFDSIRERLRKEPGGFVID